MTRFLLGLLALLAAAPACRKQGTGFAPPPLADAAGVRDTRADSAGPLPGGADAAGDTGAPADGGSSDGAGEVALDAGLADIPPADVLPAEAGPDLPAACNNGGGGLLATYFRKPDLSEPVTTRLEPSLIFDWGREAPVPGAPAGSWSAVYAGQVQPPTSDRYTFIARGDDGFRVWLDGELIIDWWHPHTGYELGASRPLVAGRRHQLRIELYNQNGPAAFRLLWKPALGTRGEIPQCQLFPAASPAPSPCSPAPGDCVYTDAPACSAGGQGLEGAYYQRDNLADGAVIRVDETVSFHWDAQSPYTGIDPRAYSVRWKGTLLPPASETVTFSIIADTSAKLWIGDQLVADTTTTGPGLEAQGPVALTAGKPVAVQLDFFKTRGQGFIKLYWQSPSIRRAVVPKCRLFPPDLP